MAFKNTEPNKREAKPAWDLVPKQLVLDIEKILQSKIIKTEIAWGGYSPSASYYLETEDGKEYFAKGTHPEQMAHGAAMLSQEIEIYKDIKYLKEISPEFLGSAKFGGEDDWYIGIWQKIDGFQKILPWDRNKELLVIKKLSEIHNDFTEADKLEKAEEYNFVDMFFKSNLLWVKIKNNIDIRNNFLSLFEDKEYAANWLDTNIDEIIKYQVKSKETTCKKSLLHFDLRSDNLGLDVNNNVLIFDWPNACYGAIIFDLIGLFITIDGEGGSKIPNLLKDYEEISKSQISIQDQKIALANISGYFACNAYRNIPEKLPRLRWIQKIQLQACLDWMETLFGFENSPKIKE